MYHLSAEIGKEFEGLMQIEGHTQEKAVAPVPRPRRGSLQEELLVVVLQKMELQKKEDTSYRLRLTGIGKPSSTHHLPCPVINVRVLQA
jgi:hypothetical protein